MGVSKEVNDTPIHEGWFHQVKGDFAPRLKQFAAQPITYVEIGVWSGASAEWVAREVLTHRYSKGIGIDPYPVTHPERHTAEYIARIKQHAQGRLAFHHNWTWEHRPSQDVFASWPHGTIDVLYIDGVHTGPGPLVDFCMAWPHLRVGSGIIFDDMRVGMRKPYAHVPEAVSAIMSCFGSLVTKWPKRSNIGGAVRRQVYLKVASKSLDEAWHENEMRRFAGEAEWNMLDKWTSAKRKAMKRLCQLKS